MQSKMQHEDIVSQETATPKSDVTSHLLSAGGVSAERLPILQDLLEQVCSSLMSDLSQLSEAAIDVTLERVWTGQATEIDVKNREHLAAQVDIANSDMPAFFIFNRNAMYLLLEYMMGASGKERPYMKERDFTLLEFLFAKTVAARLATAFCKVFGGFGDISMDVSSAAYVDELNTFPDAEPSFLLTTICIEAFDRSGLVYMIIPQHLLHAIKSKLSKLGNTPAVSSDEPWTEYIKHQLQQTDVECKAILDGGEMSLAEISALKTGQILNLGIPADRLVKLTIEGENMFVCKLGQADGTFQLKILERADSKVDLLDVMLQGQTPSLEPSVLLPQESKMP